MKFYPLCLGVAALAMVFSSLEASAQLRIVTYNTNTFGTEVGNSDVRPIRDQADIVIQAIGEEIVNGFARPADIILLQEQQRPETTTQDFVNRLNNIYSDQGITYARGTRVGLTTISNGTGPLDRNEIRQSVVFRTDSVSLIAEDSFGDLNGSPPQTRETLLHQFRPVGFGADADLFVFNAHFAASDTNTDREQRETEANEIRNFIDSNNLGNRNVIVAGDLNVPDNFSTSGSGRFGDRSPLQILAADGPGRVLDPLFPNGEEVNFQIFDSGVPNSPFGVDLEPLLTQSPSGGAGALVAGGIDDRFDFILQSDELLDGEGVASIPSSLRSFGNNGSTPNRQINDGNTISLNGVTSFTTAEVLDALELASDHLPVVEDFQLPAILAAELVSEVPLTVEQNAEFNLSLAISNAANVQVPLGADELDFQFTTTGDLFGSATGIDQALGGFFEGVVTLNTSLLGIRSGLITISSDSQSVANGQITIPVSFEVVSAIPEPGAISLLGLMSVAMLVRRKR